MDERKIAHLGYIQAIITRMAGNSFLLKGWSVTLVAALFALASKDASGRFFLFAFCPVMFFWLLDGYYFYQENLFRELYKEVAAGNISSEQFTLDTNFVINKLPNKSSFYFKEAVVPFHIVIIGMVVIAWVFLK